MSEYIYVSAVPIEARCVRSQIPLDHPESSDMCTGLNSGPLSRTVGILNCRAISLTSPLVVFLKDYIIKLLQLYIKRKLPIDKELSENTIKP